MRDDAANGNFEVAFHDFFIYRDFGIKSFRPADGNTVIEWVMIVNRKTCQYTFTEFLHKVETGERTVTAGGTDKPDIFVFNPRFGQLLQHMRNELKSAGNSRHIVKNDDNLFLAPGKFSDWSGTDGISERLTDFRRGHRRFVTAGHMTHFNLPTIGKRVLCFFSAVPGELR